MRFVLAVLVLYTSSTLAYENTCKEDVDKFLGCSLSLKENGVQKTYNFKYGLIHGLYEERDSDNNILSKHYTFNKLSSSKVLNKDNTYIEYTYKNGIRHGKSVFLNDKDDKIGNYTFGLKDGVWTDKDSYGNKIYIYYSNGFETVFSSDDKRFSERALNTPCKTNYDLEHGCMLLENHNDVYNIKYVEQGYEQSYYVQVDAKTLTMSNVNIGEDEDYIVRQETMEPLYRYVDDIANLKECKDEIDLKNKSKKDNVRCFIKDESTINSILYRIDNKLIVIDKNDSLSASITENEVDLVDSDIKREIIYKYNGYNGQSNLFKVSFKNTKGSNFISKGSVLFYDNGDIKESNYLSSNLNIKTKFYLNNKIKSYEEDFNSSNNKESSYKSYEYYESGKVKKIIYFKNGELLFGMQFYENGDTQYLIEDVGNDTLKYSAYLDYKTKLSVLVSSRTNIVKEGTCSDGLPLLQEDLDAFMRGDKFVHCRFMQDLNKKLYKTYDISYYNGYGNLKDLNKTSFMYHKAPFRYLDTYIKNKKNLIKKEERALLLERKKFGDYEIKHPNNKNHVIKRLDNVKIIKTIPSN